MRDSHHAAGKAPNGQKRFLSPLNIKQHLQKVPQKGQSSTGVLCPGLAASSPPGAGRAVPGAGGDWGGLQAAVKEKWGGLSPAQEIETCDVIHLTKLPTAKLRHLFASCSPRAAQLVPRGIYDRHLCPARMSPFLSTSCEVTSCNAVTQLVAVQSWTGPAQPRT